ncbi:MAG: chemotaxis protein CheA [candidate division Zixibacteria bacterium]
MSTTDVEMIGLDEMQEIIVDFLVEADELVNSLDNNLVKLEETPEDPDLLNEIFRAAHTIKGTSGFLSLDDITSLTHKMEDVLNKMRKGTLKVNGNIMDVLLESVDNLKILLQDVSDHKKVDRDLSGIISKLVAINEGQEIESVNEEKTPPKDEISVQKGSENKPAAPVQQSAKKQNNVAGGNHQEKETIRVEVNRLDTLMNLMGELVLSRNSLLQTTNNLGREHEDLAGMDDLNRAGSQINFVTTEIQLAVMKMRMLPIEKVFTKFPRMVRDLSREAKKKIKLEMFGEETELDKSVIESIGDPLVHLIRNSCDHGIEIPEDRIANGKPEEGTIRLGASQEGSNIVISIEDDGKGLDIEAIKSKAIERGLTTPEEVERLTSREIYSFIFQPGFSTAKKVTDVSGRGVGMDVVRTNIEKLKGIIDIESEVGKGTTISIKLPLTLAILQGLLIISEDETYIVPLASVLETLRVSLDEIESVNRRRVITLRDGLLPIVNLNHVLRGRANTADKSENPYVVVVGLADRRLGLIVDELLGQEEVVIKSMGHMLGKAKGLAGATILGDGRVRLIVDLIGLFKLANEYNK